MAQEETDLYLVQQEKQKYWNEVFTAWKRGAIIFLTMIIFSFIVCLCIFYKDIFYKNFFPTLCLFILTFVLSNVIYQMLVYKYFVEQRHRAKFYRKYMSEVIATFVISFIVIIVVSLVSFYMNKYLLFSLSVVPILSTYSISKKYKKLKIEYPPLPHLSLNKALYRDEFIEKYEKYLFYEDDFSGNLIQDMVIIYYYLNVVLYDNNIEPISLEDENIFDKVYEISSNHLKDKNNQDLYHKIKFREILLKRQLCRTKSKILVSEFFA